MSNWEPRIKNQRQAEIRLQLSNSDYWDEAQGFLDGFAGHEPTKKTDRYEVGWLTGSQARENPSNNG